MFNFFFSLTQNTGGKYTSHMIEEMSGANFINTIIYYLFL